MFIEEVPISVKNESVCWKKQTDIVTQQWRLLGTAIKQEGNKNLGKGLKKVS